MPARRLLSLFAAATLLAPLHAQTIDEIVPPVAEPDELVILRGQDLAGTQLVSFTAFPGGFVGVLTKHATPLSVTATEVRVLVPKIQAFVGHQGTPPSTPYGEVSIQLVTPVVVPHVDFFFVEETMGALETVGQGSSLPGGSLRPVIAFDLKAGAPLVPPPISAPGAPYQPNRDFRPRLHDALQGQLPFLLVGAPATPPYPLIGDGTLVVDPGVVVVLAAPAVDADGHSELLLPVPQGISGTVMLQWVALDFSSLDAYVSNGLQAQL